MSVFGSGRGNSRFKPRNYFSLGNGEQAYRILPPLGNARDTNRWSAYYAVHHGYKTSDGKKVAFVSPEVVNKETKMVEVPDAAKDRLEMLQVELEKAKESGNEEATRKLNSLLGYYDNTAKKFVSGIYNLDKKYYMNVLDANGNIGVLKLGHKAKVELEREVTRLETAGTYPISPEDGRYFVFNRSGSGRDTTVTVRVLKEKITVTEEASKSLGLKAGTVVEGDDVVHVLTEEIGNRCASLNADGKFVYKEAVELGTMFKKFTSEEVSKIVETSNLKTGVSTYLDELVGKTTQVSSEETASEAPAPVAQASAPAPKAKTTPAPQVISPKVTGTVKVAPKTTSAVLEEQSDDDFLASLN